MNHIPSTFTERVKEKLGEAAATVYSLEVKRRIEEGGSFVRDPARESIILHDWRFAYLYSRNFIGGRWQAFEDAISEAPAVHDQAAIRCVYNYVRYVRGSRMQSAEKHIANDARSAVDYSQHVLRQPWRASMEDGDQANETISRHPTAASAYRMGM
jgi:hypothetical protein|nr:hypothetical protein [Neorhizobium tomejilense]